MIPINLLPLAERPSKWPVNRMLLVTGFLIIMIFSGIYSYSLFAVWNIEKQLQDTRNQYQLLQPTRVIMASAQNKQRQFDKKNNILVVLTKERRSWYGIIQHLTAITAPQIWFTEMVRSDKGTIQIKGWATSYLVVAEFMKKMENDQFFIEPVLTSVEKDTVTQANKFEIVVKPRGI